MLYKLEAQTKELVALSHEIIDLTNEFREQWSQRLA